MKRRGLFKLLASLPIFGSALAKTGYAAGFRALGSIPARPYAVPPTLWFENKDGDRYIPDAKQMQEADFEPHPGFKYMWTQFPCELHDSCTARGEGELMHGTSGWNATEDLVLALANNRGYRLSEAILIVATMCERCTNAAAWANGIAWGYPVNSQQWKDAGTTCDHCSRRYTDPDENGIMRKLPE